MKPTRFDKIRNEADKKKHLQDINSKSKIQQTLFQNPFFQIQEEENEQEQLLGQIQKLENNNIKVEKNINLQTQFKVKSHIINHKLKNNYDWVRLKYLIRIWREQALKIKIQEEIDKQNVVKQNNENMIEVMIKNQRYENLKNQQAADDDNIIEQDEHQDQDLAKKFLMKKISAPAHDDKPSLFRMPEEDLLQYIPYCTDIYLGKD